MSRNIKILSYALAFASLSLICLEASHADSATEDAGAPLAAAADAGANPIPTEHRQSILTVSNDSRKKDAGRAARPLDYYKLELNIDPQGQIKEFFYYGPCDTDSSPCKRGPMVVSPRQYGVQRLQSSGGITLETYQNQAVAILTAPADFSPVTGGGVTLKYVDHIDLASGSLVWGSFPMTLALDKGTSSWVVSKNTSNSKDPVTQLAITTRFCELAFYQGACGVSQIDGR
jgi:hypothetical protein